MRGTSLFNAVSKRSQRLLQQIKTDNKARIIAAISLIGIVLVILVGFYGIKLYGLYRTIHVESTQTLLDQSTERQEIINVLLMGYGGENHDGEFLTDTLMVAHIDTNKKSIKLISIPRDAWVRIPTTRGGDYFTKINAVYTFGLDPNEFPYPDTDISGQRGAVNLLRSVVFEMTGVVIDYFVAVDFNGFTKLIDALGGIEVNVQTSFDDYRYPVEARKYDLCDGSDPVVPAEEASPEAEILTREELEERIEKFSATPLTKEEAPFLEYPCRYEHLHFEAGVQTMDGETALKFARSRMSLEDGGDFNRARRQQQVIKAVQEKVMSINIVPRIMPILEELGDHIRTDIPISIALRRVIADGAGLDQYTLETAVLTDENVFINTESEDGQAILVPQEGIGQWKAVRKFVDELIRGVEPSPTVEPGGSYVTE